MQSSKKNWNKPRGSRALFETEYKRIAGLLLPGDDSGCRRTYRIHLQAANERRNRGQIPIGGSIDWPDRWLDFERSWILGGNPAGWYSCYRSTRAGWRFPVQRFSTIFSKPVRECWSRIEKSARRSFDSFFSRRKVSSSSFEGEGEKNTTFLEKDCSLEFPRGSSYVDHPPPPSISINKITDHALLDWPLVWIEHGIQSQKCNQGINEGKVRDFSLPRSRRWDCIGEEFSRDFFFV